MKSYTTFKRNLLKNDGVKAEYDQLYPEFRLVESFIEKRLKVGLTQSALAKKIGTKQSAIARFESGSYNPSLGFLKRVAHALGADILIGLYDVK